MAMSAHPFETGLDRTPANSVIPSRGTEVMVDGFATRTSSTIG